MIERVKPRYWQKILSQYHFVRHKSHMDWPGIEAGPLRRQSATDRLSQAKAPENIRDS